MRLTNQRGFAGMDEQRQREIAREGGRAAHASGRAHEFTSLEAKVAGRKGGSAHRGSTMPTSQPSGQGRARGQGVGSRGR